MADGRWGRADAALRAGDPVPWPAVVGIVVLGGLVGALSLTAEPVDVTYFAPFGRALLHGRLDEVYVEPGNQGGPLELALAAVVHPLVGSAAGLRVLGGLTGAVVLLGLVLASRALRSTRVPELVAAALAVLWLVAGSGTDAHSAQLAVPALWAAAAACAVRGRPLLGALLVALSTTWETWGLIGVPVLLAGGTRRGAGAAAAATAGAAALWAPFVLSGRFAMTEHAWRTAGGTLAGHLVGSGEEFSWQLRLLQGGLAALVCAGATLSLRGRPEVVWLPAAAALGTKLLLDPVSYTYYGVAPLVLCLLGAALTRRVTALALAVVLAGVAAGPLDPAAPLSCVVFLALAAVAVTEARRPGSELAGPHVDVQQQADGHQVGEHRGPAVADEGQR